MQVKFPKTRKLLSEYQKMKFDYGKCIKKQIDIVKSLLDEAGNSGFSAQYISMSLIRDTHMIKGPFMIVKLEDCFYPQLFNPIVKVRKFITESTDWLKKEAKKMLKGKDLHPEVREHIKKISKGDIGDII